MFNDYFRAIHATVSHFDGAHIEIKKSKPKILGSLSNHDEREDDDVKQSRRVCNEDVVFGEKIKLKQLLKDDDDVGIVVYSRFVSLTNGIVQRRSKSSSSQSWIKFRSR